MEAHSSLRPIQNSCIVAFTFTRRLPKYKTNAMGKQQTSAETSSRETPIHRPIYIPRKDVVVRSYHLIGSGCHSENIFYAIDQLITMARPRAGILGYASSHLAELDILKEKKALCKCRAIKNASPNKCFGHLLGYPLHFVIMIGAYRNRAIF